MDGKVALITGGATGIGKKTAYMLAGSGAAVIITYRKSRKEAERVMEDIAASFGVRAMAIQADASIEEDCARAVGAVIENFGKIDIFIHNAGPYIQERKPMADYTSEEWNYLMNGNLNGFFYMAKEIIPSMRKNLWGRVISFGFERSDTAPAWIYRSAFAAAKSGLTSLTKTLALEEAPYGITVNMVCPGDITQEWKEKDIIEAAGISDDTVPVGRPGTGQDLARVIRFLCDHQSDFITGSIIPVTGGKDVLAKIFHK
ncbi:SDR family oxidoreductase [Bacillus sp. MUM 13]|uniref:SDR family oxidoreductase n=1 Tax=Bacillus sp. MUM 13 TaxID=1678001 RepID=UPI0008F574FE|nr:SDR family oxidoreductase [Bacillus sp. MUM 13]OIK09519.1 3-oxoacyl-ACP reductase [Bacillus sp. MUM 13]